MSIRHGLLMFAVAGFLVGLANHGQAQTRDEKVIEDREALVDDDSWFYDNLPAGIEEARATGKPLMVVLRCIP